MRNKIHFLAQRVFYSKHDEKYDTDAAWQKMELASRKKGTSRTLLLGYAAAMAIVFCAGGYMWHSLVLENQPILAAITIPQKQQIELILVNGKRFELTNIRQENKNEGSDTPITQDSTHKILSYAIDSISPEEYITEYNQLNVPKGGEYSFRLPDGSVVRINSESSLRFPVNFKKDSREVYLEGEAFFEIIKNESAPFSVITGEKKITVLGTRFNVSAYPEDQLWQTTLVEGKIVVHFGKEEKILFPSQQCTIDNQNEKIEVKEVDTEPYTSWLDGKFCFKGYRFEDIIKKMERWYDFQMIYEEESIKDMLFRGVVYKHQPLEETLHYLEETTNIKFHINDNKITVKKQ